MASGAYDEKIHAHTTGIVCFFILAFTALAFFVLKRRDVVSDAAVKNTLTTFGLFGFNLAFVPVAYLATGWVQSLYTHLHVPQLPNSVWASLPTLLVMFIALAVKDFVDYWTHRVMHTKWLWPVHAVHHSDSHVNGFTAYRVHILETVVMKSSYIFLLTWMGLPKEHVAAIALFEALHSAYVHLEADIDHGPLNWLIASPRFHRWHHADNPVVFGKNLANHIPLYDLVFGTYYNPAACTDQMGALSSKIPDRNILSLAALPFTLWGQLIHRKMRKLHARPTRDNQNQNHTAAAQ